MVYRERYSGNDILCLKESPEALRAFSFGRRKAKLIIQHINEIRAFATELEQGTRKPGGITYKGVDLTVLDPLSTDPTIFVEDKDITPLLTLQERDDIAERVVALDRLYGGDDDC